MVSYRFCRPDDLPLLAEAINTCYNIHFPQSRPLDLDGIKTEVRELDLWSSSCMVALLGERPVAVLIGAKREKQTGILRIGVQPAFQRQGHASHLVRSLSQKLAILGPPALHVELAEADHIARRFFEKAGFQPDTELADFELSRPLEPIDGGDAIQPVTVQDLMAFPDLWRASAVAWDHTPGSLRERAERLKVAALIAGDQIIAFLAYQPLPQGGSILHRFGCHDPANAARFAPLLLRFVCSQAGLLPAHAPKWAQAELPFTTLAALGFRKLQTHWIYRALATPG